MTDGTATFIVRDVRCKYRTGEIVALYGEPEAWDYLLLCDGSTVSADNYPELCEALGGNTLPNLIDRVLQGGSVSGQYKGAGLPNITGYVSIGRADGQCATFSATGAMVQRDSYIGLYSLRGCPVSSGMEKWDGGVGINASRSNAIYGNSSTVQPPAMTIKYYICYA